MARRRLQAGGRPAGQRIQAVPEPTNRGGRIAAGVVNLVANTAVSALAGARDVGAELGGLAVNAVKGSIRAAGEIGADVGRLAVDAAEGAIHAADRITTAAGRAANNLIDTAMT